MKPVFFRLSIFVPVYFWAAVLAAQHTVKNEVARHEPIELLSPKGTNISQPGQIIYKHTGNVKLRHKGALLFCDQTIQYVTANRLEATGHVLIVQGDTIIVKADTLVYAGNDRQAILSGRVAFQDRRIVLNAARLEYDLTTGIVHYASRGRLVDSRNVMTSREGYYNTRSRQIEMKQGVRLVSPDNTLTADLLLYNTSSRMAVIMSPTRITGKDGVSVAQQGQYDTQNGTLQSAATEPSTYAGRSEPSGQPAAPVAGSAKRSESVSVKADETMVASQNNRPTAVGESVAAHPDTDKPAANSITNLTAAELMMRLANAKTSAAPAKKGVDKPAVTVAKSNEALPLATVPVKPANPVAAVPNEAPEPPKGSGSPTVAQVAQSPVELVAQPVRPELPVPLATPPASLSPSVSVAKIVDKPIEKLVSPPVAVAATSPNPQTPPTVPIPAVETSVATVNTRLENSNKAGDANVALKEAPAPSVLIPQAPKTAAVKLQPANSLAVAVPANKPADRPSATVTPSSGKGRSLPEANATPAVKKPVSLLRQPATPAASANVAAVMAPTPKPDEQVSLVTTDTKKAESTAGPTPKAADPKKDVLPTPAAPSSSVRTAALRVSVLPAAKRPVKPDALVVPDASMSDLERELNHKKRVH